MKTLQAYYPLHQKKGEVEKIYDHSEGRYDLFGSEVEFVPSERRSAFQIDGDSWAMNKKCIPVDIDGDFILTLRCSTKEVSLRFWEKFRVLTAGVLEDEIS